MSSEDRENDAHEGATMVGSTAIKWAAIVIIVLATLYFLAQFVIPLFA